MRQQLGVLVVAAGMTLGPVTVAHGADDQLRLSLDGRTWAPTIERALFDPARVWVPGDTVSVPVWVRNASGEPADLTIDVVGVTGNLRIGGDLRFSAVIGDRTVIPQSGRLRSDSLPAGPTRILLTISFPEGAGNDTQRQQGTFRLRLTLVQAVEPAPTQPPRPSTEPIVPEVGPTTAASHAPVDPLAGTGAAAGVMSLAALGAALTVTGTGLLRRSRTRVRR